jgi:hypothetical protein
MSHETFRDQLVSPAQASAGDPGGFLEGLSPTFGYLPTCLAGAPLTWEPREATR